MSCQGQRPVEVDEAGKWCLWIGIGLLVAAVVLLVAIEWLLRAR